jgi:hypothetical protein
VLAKKKENHGKASKAKRKTIYDERFSIAEKKLYEAGKKCKECFIHGETSGHTAQSCNWKGDNWKSAKKDWFVSQAKGKRDWFLDQ